MAGSGKARLILEILRASVRARRAMRRRDLRAAVAELRDGAPATVPDGGSALPEAARLGRAVHRTLELIPAHSCLLQSLTLTRLLASRGFESTLVIGVRPEGRFGAHAWVEVDGHPLLPPGEGSFERFVQV